MTDEQWCAANGLAWNDPTMPLGSLKRCPFCGAPAKVVMDGDHYDMLMCGGNNCAFQPMIWVADHGSPNAAAAAWNSRVTDDEARLRELMPASGMETRSAIDPQGRGPKGDSPTAESGDAQ